MIIATQIYSKDQLPSEYWTWPKYRKKTLTSAIKIDGPFRVITRETENEPFLCQDGYLALDARGYPYAIATEEFIKIYEEALREPLQRVSLSIT